MTKFTASIVSAAINTIADNIISEAKISPTNADGMAKAMSDAENMVARQLVRAGMTLKDATNLAEEAAGQFGKDSPEAAALAGDAFSNRFAEASEPVAPAAPVLPAPVSLPVSEPEAIVAVGPDTSHSNSSASNAPGTATIESPGLSAAPQFASPPVVGAVTAVHHIQPRELMDFSVAWLPVHEVFKSIDSNDSMFDFKIPFINWAGKHQGVPPIDKDYNMDLEDLMTMLYAMAERRTTNLVGPHGCGKTEFVSQIAARLNFPLSVFPMDGQMTRSHLIGKERLIATPAGPRTYFADGVLPLALAEPGILLFDEIDRSTSDLHYACHSVYLQKGLALMEDDGRFLPMHDFNRVFATSNTKGRGSMDGMYQASEEMSEASRDRLSLWVEMDYQSAEDDTTVLKAKVNNIGATEAASIAKLAALIREAFLGHTLSQTCSMRQQIEVANYYAFLARRETDQDRKAKMLKAAVDRVICGRASDEDKGAISGLLATIIPNAFEGPGLFD